MDVTRLLREHGLRPSKGLGQNFLISRKTLERIVAAANLAADDVVLEIGPGLGILTERLADRAGHIVAVEIDARLVEILRGGIGQRPNVHIVQGDILSLDVADLLSAELDRCSATFDRYAVVANLPYYITSACLRHLLTASKRPDSILVMVQREVGRRLVAAPGDTSLLSISVQVYGRPEIICTVPPGAFYPRPEVSSALVRIEVYDTPLVAPEMEGRFFDIVRAGFGQRRKQLVNSLGHGLGLKREAVSAALLCAGIDPKRRAQSLSIDEWCLLTEALRHP